MVTYRHAGPILPGFQCFVGILKIEGAKTGDIVVLAYRNFKLLKRPILLPVLLRFEFTLFNSLFNKVQVDLAGRFDFDDFLAPWPGCAARLQVAVLGVVLDECRFPIFPFAEIVETHPDIFWGTVGCRL